MPSKQSTCLFTIVLAPDFDSRIFISLTFNTSRMGFDAYAEICRHVSLLFLASTNVDFSDIPLGSISLFDGATSQCLITILELYPEYYDRPQQERTIAVISTADTFSDIANPWSPQLFGKF